MLNQQKKRGETMAATTESVEPQKKVHDYLHDTGTDLLLNDNPEEDWGEAFVADEDPEENWD